MSLIILILLMVSSNSFAFNTPKVLKKLSCSAPLPLVIGPQSNVVLLPTQNENGKRSITFRKNSKTSTQSFNADCIFQASILNCKWKTGKIVIDTTQLKHDSGINTGLGNVGAYNYFSAKTTIKRSIFNKVENVRCRVK